MQPIQDNISKLPSAESESKKDGGEFMILTKDEGKYFIEEVEKQFAVTGVIDIGRAVRNARYLADIDRGFAEIEAGHWTEHELIEVDGDE